MTKPESKVLSLAEIVDVIEDLVGAGKTGTLYLLTDSKHFVRFGLRQGRIIHCLAGLHQGEDALPDIQSIQSAKCSFSEGNVSVSQPHFLPSTPEVLGLLRRAAAEGVTASARPVDRAPQRSAAQPIPNVVPLASAAGAAETVTPLGINGEALYALVIRELASCLGPMAAVVAADYEGTLKSPITAPQLREIVWQLAEEIEDPEQAAEFSSRILESVGGD